MDKGNPLNFPMFRYLPTFAFTPNHLLPSNATADSEKLYTHVKSLRIGKMPLDSNGR